MFDENQIVQMKWHNTTRKYYESKGYEFTKYGDVFYVAAKDLTSGSKAMVQVICDYCGESYYTTMKNYNRTESTSDACKKCNMKKVVHNNRLDRAKKHFDTIKDICNEHGYTLITDESEYVNSHTKIKYMCPKHGVQSVTVDSMLNGRLCRKCGYEKISNIKTHTPEYVKDYIEKFNNNKLLNPYEYQGTTVRNLKVLCSCGRIFFVSLNDYMCSDIKRCSYCSGKESRGEFQIRKFLEENNINFVQEYRFKDCRDAKPLPFDFYIPDYNILIEFDGQGHYQDTHGIESLETTKKHDTMKNEYCEEHNIPLIRIPYWEGNHIEDILTKELNL